MAWQRRLGFESLESRKVCAGNVNVAVVGGTLSITGDGAANYVDIQQQSIGGVTKFVVAGKAFSGGFNSAGAPVISGPATTINGSSAPFRGVATKLDVELAGGNDAVVLGGTGLAINLTALSVNTGAASDYARLSNVRVSGAAFTKIEMTQADGTSLDGQKEAGNDNVVIDGMSLGSGGMGFLIATGGGNDRVTANNFKVSAAAQNTYVDMGNGADTLAVTNGIFSNVNLLMGSSAEKDVVTVQSLQAKRVQVDLGAGNGDLLNLISNVKVTNSTVLNGGAGTGDQLKVGSNVSAAGRSITGFEIKPFGL